MIDPAVERTIYSVSQLTDKIKTLLEENFPFIWISGEISNFKVPVSGHFYFTLKDSHAQINAIMFRGQNRHLKFVPEDGMKITGFGRISVYQPRGAYQIILEYLEPTGAGALQAAFEQLKARLSNEGLFDEKHKKPIPFLPSKIDLITSSTGSVVHDMIRVIHRRYPNMTIRILPVSVQGDEAVEEIISALSLVNQLPDAEVVIIARGGGSLEDLSAFNAEPLARAIFASRVPVISAVGHETDYTIADFVADLRAPTPSAAAEMVVPVKKDLVRQQTVLFRQLQLRFDQYLRSRLSHVHHLSRRLVHPGKRLDYLKIRLDEVSTQMTRAFHHVFGQKHQHLTWLTHRLKKQSPRTLIQAHREQVARHNETLLFLSKSLINSKMSVLKELTGRLSALNPAAVLSRGYSITRSLSDKTIITDAATVSAGQLLEILLAKGTLTCRVERKIFDGKEKNI